MLRRSAVSPVVAAHARRVGRSGCACGADDSPPGDGVRRWARIRAVVFARDDYCRYCGARGIYLEADHVVPLSRGGPTTEQTS
ncbi:HNH endonuclease [Burkholderia glumae]|uniref:HNH endonuclease n=1 Tax=Burkholderia glumae TaxID=337 RepID=UPI0039A7802A